MFASARRGKFWSDEMPLFMISIAENLYEFFFFFFGSFVACLKSSVHVVGWFDFDFAKPHTHSINTSIDFHKCNVNAIQFSLPQIRFDFHFCFKSYFIDISCSLRSIASDENCMTQFHERKMSWGASLSFSSAKRRRGSNGKWKENS